MLAQIVKGLPSTRQRKSVSDGDWIPPPPAAALKLLQQQLKEANSLAMPFTSDERVVISTSWPSEPPMSLRFEASSGFSDTTLNATRIHKRSLRSTRSLHQPVSSSSSSLVPACESVSRWVKLTEVEDLWENRVTVLQEFDNGSGSRVSQYFFETYCNRPAGASTDRPPSCIGTDAVNYDSVCLEKHIYAYGKVYYAEQREERWTFVKIRASCNCAVIRKNNRRSRRSHVKG